MPVHNPGLHHLHKRKRIYLKHEPYPHPDKWKRLVDKFIYVVGILGPIMTVPQIMKVWIERNAAGISVTTWLAYTIMSFFWIIYGIIHKEKPIIVSSGLLFITNLLVVVGTLVYSV